MLYPHHFNLFFQIFVRSRFHFSNFILYSFPAIFDGVYVGRIAGSVFQNIEIVFLTPINNDSCSVTRCSILLQNVAARQREPDMKLFLQDREINLSVYCRIFRCKPDWTSSATGYCPQIIIDGQFLKLDTV